MFDLDAGPVTITMPDAGKRFMSLMIVNEDHYVPSVTYDAGPHVFTKEKIGTRYMLAGVRTLVDPVDPKDVAQVHVLQDGIKADQKSAGTFEAPNWDQASQKKVRDALLVLATTIPDFKKAFGTKEQVDPIRHLIATAAAWGGNPDKDAVYLNVTPERNDGNTVYKLDVMDVPVNGFWSVSLYDEKGYLREEPVQRLFDQQYHRAEKRRRLDRDPVRRLRRQDCKLPADHEGLELHRAALSASRRNSERQMEIPGAATSELRGSTMSGLDIFAWIVLIILVTCVVAVFCIAGWLPGHIAKSRGHPWAEAVTVAGWVTLICGFALWPVVLIWAFVDVPARRLRSAQ